MAERTETKSKGNEIIDPVCGRCTDIPEPYHSYEYEGEKHYFCNLECMHKFQEAPDYYLQADKKRPALISKNEWICPMHPEVVQDKPGQCPKCSLEMEPWSVMEGE